MINFIYVKFREKQSVGTEIKLHIESRDWLERGTG